MLGDRDALISKRFVAHIEEQFEPGIDWSNYASRLDSSTACRLAAFVQGQLAMRGHVGLIHSLIEIPLNYPLSVTSTSATLRLCWNSLQIWQISYADLLLCPF